MSKRIYTKEEIESLRSNQYVERCSERSITFSIAFKEFAVSQYDVGLTPREIFEHAQFDLTVIGLDKPKECLKRWRQTVEKKGVGGLVETRGSKGRPKTIFDSDKEKWEYMEAKIAYLEEENNFLRKLRATRKRAEQ